MQIRDRVKELRRVPAGRLRPHPQNWRSHPVPQRDALQGLLAEIGFAGALLVRELDDGSLQLIDGHLRAEILPDSLVPVLILDVDEVEARKLLALVDPIAGMAQPQMGPLRELLAGVDSQNEAINRLLAHLAEETPQAPGETSPPDARVPESYQVVVDCRDECQQRELYERLASEGYRCHVLTL